MSSSSKPKNTLRHIFSGQDLHVIGTAQFSATCRMYQIGKISPLPFKLFKFVHSFGYLGSITHCLQIFLVVIHGFALLTDKSELFDIFVSFKSLVQNFVDRKLNLTICADLIFRCLIVHPAILSY